MANEFENIPGHVNTVWVKSGVVYIHPVKGGEAVKRTDDKAAAKAEKEAAAAKAKAEKEAAAEAAKAEKEAAKGKK